MPNVDQSLIEDAKREAAEFAVSAGSRITEADWDRWAENSTALAAVAESVQRKPAEEAKKELLAHVVYDTRTAAVRDQRDKGTRYIRRLFIAERTQPPLLPIPDGAFVGAGVYHMKAGDEEFDVPLILLQFDILMNELEAKEKKRGREADEILAHIPIVRDMDDVQGATLGDMAEIVWKRLTADEQEDEDGGSDEDGGE